MVLIDWIVYICTLLIVAFLIKWIAIKELTRPLSACHCLCKIILFDMDTLKLLRPHKFLFKFFGIWLQERNLLSFLHVSIAFYLITLVLIFTLFTSILFVSSKKQAIDNLIVSSSSVLALLKGIVFHLNYSKNLQIFKSIQKLDKDIEWRSQTETSIIARVIRAATLLFRIFAATYISAWISLLIQNILGSSEKVFWSSTALYPGEISQDRVLYWVVLIFQGLSNLELVFLVFSFDTYGFIITMILSAHFDVLTERLRNLGSKKNIANPTTSSQLIDSTTNLKECVKRFYVCIK